MCHIYCDIRVLSQLFFHVIGDFHSQVCFDKFRTVTEFMISSRIITIFVNSTMTGIQHDNVVILLFRFYRNRSRYICIIAQRKCRYFIGSCLSQLIILSYCIFDII